MENFPSWYESTSGPKVSQTITNIVGNVIPMLNLVLASKGINILPDSINPYISIAVFVFFSVRAAIGYVKAKKAMGARIENLKGQVQSLGGSAQ